MIAPIDAKYNVGQTNKCPLCQGKKLFQETDTFDTWFLSGQWPLTTLGYPDSQDFKYFYPTSVLDTMWDILFFWVARMMMFGLYLAGDVPFKVAHMHSRVVDVERKKMSKSKGNVIDPIQMVKKYGADAVRMCLVYGVAPASDIVVTEEKIRSMRNFSNKIWNASRFVLSHLEGKWEKIKNVPPSKNHDDKWILGELDQTIKKVTQQIDTYYFGQAAEVLYDFFWHKYCDRYLEKCKTRLPDSPEALSTLYHVLSSCLKLLHPFMPFVTEAVWQKFPEAKKKPLIVTSWPTIDNQVSSKHNQPSNTAKPIN